MSPEAAVDAQIARCRAMTPEQQMLTALRSHEFACEMARLGIRRLHRGADSNKVERLLHQRLELARAS
jgi:hypothetical protein